MRLRGTNHKKIDRIIFDVCGMSVTTRRHDEYNCKLSLINFFMPDTDGHNSFIKNFSSSFLSARENLSGCLNVCDPKAVGVGYISRKLACAQVRFHRQVDNHFTLIIIVRSYGRTLVTCTLT